MSVLASEVLALPVPHHYEKMAHFNFPVNASLVQPYLHPSLKLDLDEGMAWVSIVSSRLSVPLLKPLEVQMRTYVTGPHPVSKQPVKGLWFFNVYMLDANPVKSLEAFYAASLLVNESIPLGANFDEAPEEIVMHETSMTYTLKASGKPLGAIGRKAIGGASFYAHSTIQDTKVEFDSDFFLDRSAWFGSTGLYQKGGYKTGELTVNMLRASKFPTSPRPMEVNEFSSGVFTGFGLGQPNPRHCFFIWEHDVTFESSVVVTSSEYRQPLLV